MQVQCRLSWWVGHKTLEELPPTLIQLLEGIARGGNLRVSAQESKLSYRHAWGVLKAWERRLETPLVALARGRGATLTRAGERLCEAWQKSQRQSAGCLAEAAAQATRALQSLVSEGQQQKLLITASHGFGMSALVAQLRRVSIEPEIQFVGSEEALKRYAAGECQVAGFHLPLGKHGRSLWSKFQQYLDARRDVLALVETRELGFMARPGTPRFDIEVLVRRQLRFQNRQPGSGSRLIFDLLLTEAGFHADDIVGYHNAEYTHIAVAAVVAGGGADAGFGARAAAEKFGLQFWPEVTERYLIAFPRAQLQQGPAASLTKLLSGSLYRKALHESPGSNPRGAGKLLELKEVAALIRAPGNQGARARQ